MADEPHAGATRRRVIYSGRVQGVGFRYTCLELSQDHAVVGYVRNCPDGTVELEAEGVEGAVDSFLDSVRRCFGSSIRDTVETKLPARGAEGRFEIRH